MLKLDKIESRIKKILKRNERVECDKAWETSISRKIIISCLTYLVILSYFIYADFDEPYKGALVPAIGFFLSTLTMKYFKDLWIKYIYKNKK